MKIRAEDIKKGFGRTDQTFVVWVAVEDAYPALARGRVCIPVKFADGHGGYLFPKYGEETEGEYGLVINTRRRRSDPD